MFTDNGFVYAPSAFGWYLKSALISNGALTGLL